MKLPADWTRARIEGLKRQAFVERNRGTSPRTSLENPARESILGELAEHALAQGLDVPMGNFYAHPNGDPGFDLVTCVGLPDVKGVAKPPWYLPAKDTTLAKQPGPDFFLLAHCPDGEPFVEFLGFVTRLEMELAPHTDDIFDPDGRHARDPTWKTIDRVPGRWIPVNRPLHPPELFVETVKRGRAFSFWVCQSCGAGDFQALRPSCLRCGIRMETSWRRS